MTGMSGECFSAEVMGESLIFYTSAECFSPNAVDRGTLAMLSVCNLSAGEKVLDLGCGYGVVGIWAAKITDPRNVFMLDVCRSAVLCARKNAVINQTGEVTILESDGFEALTETGFDVILSNPPYHADFSVAKRFIEKGFNRLRIGGRMLMVVKREKWYQNKLTAVFGGCRKYEIGGYFVFEAVRKDMCRHDLARRSKK